MNILISDKWLRQWVKMKQAPAEFAAAISLVGPAVERIHEQGAGLKKVVVGKIVEVLPHPDADKLRICIVDVGGKRLNIVCGGTNLAPGQLVAVALVGASVRWHGQGEPVKLEAAKIRGVASEGMICGANELGLEDRFPHGEKEIMDLTAMKLAVGSPVAKALRLDDIVYDIEVTSNRPDAFGVVGLAREAAAATGGEFLWKEPVLKVPRSKSEALSVEIKAKKLCSRYAGALIEGVKVGASPDWMQDRLVASGLRPINAAADITNYVMLELGQPMHAFDAEKIKNRSIIVRTASAGEKIIGLDDLTHELTPEMLVIADTNGPVAVAGIIGGDASKVTETTTSIILEAATFNGTSVRRTGRALNLCTDAAMRFEKQVPQGLAEAALARAVELVLEICGGELIDTEDVVAAKETPPTVSIAVAALNAKIGVEISPAEIKKHLSALGFKTAIAAGKVSAKVPYWRCGDISISEDLVEEVARLHGYGRLPAVLPPNLSGEAPDPVFGVEDRVGKALAAAGANGIISNSLVGPELLKQSGESEMPAVRLANPLSADLDTLRPSHRARLLDTVRINEKNFAVGSAFEIGKIFTPPVDDGDLPVESLSLGIVVWGKEEDGALFYKAKGLVERAGQSVHVPLTFGRDFPKNDFWHPGRTASIHLGTAVVGTVGELTPDARRAAGTESRLAIALLDFAELAKASRPNVSYRETPAFPPVLRDVAFVLDRRTEHEFIVQAIRDADPLIALVELFDRYEGKGIEPGKKSLAYHLTYQASDRTLTAAEADAAHAKVVRMLEHKFKAIIRE
jgi:phenylalanyl-tRNA synthetase beta chain